MNNIVTIPKKKPLKRRVEPASVLRKNSGASGAWRTSLVQGQTPDARHPAWLSNLGWQPVGPQPKLRINAPGDRYEQEADRVAEQVMRTPELTGPTRISPFRQPAVQRLAAHESPARADAVVVAEEEEAAAVQTLRPAGLPGGQAEIAKTSLEQGSGGAPLPAFLRQDMEDRFQTGFGAVRIHADARAARLSQSIRARAFTYGAHIYFDRGEYRPGAWVGRRILAHELTHVVQQGAAKTAPALPGAGKVNLRVSPLGIVQRLGRPGRVTRTGVAPWGGDWPTGVDYEVDSNGGSTVAAWEAYTPFQERYSFWCHGHSLDTYANFGYSVYSGPDMAAVLADEWQSIAPGQTRAGDIAVWTTRMNHSAKFTAPAVSNGQLDPDQSRLSTKNGQNALTTMSLSAIAGVYGGQGIAVYRRK